MNLALFISKRYFFSRKKKNFINVIAIISMVVVSIGTAALIIVLSVFNGMEDLFKSINSEFDAHLELTPREGKSMVYPDSFRAELLQIDGITDVIEVVEDNALLRYKTSQKIVKVKGVSDNFITNQKLKSSIRQGSYTLYQDSLPTAIIGRGIQALMNIDLRDEYTALQLYYPKSGRAVNHMRPDQMFSRARITPTASFALEQSYDNNYVIVPIAFAEKLFRYEGKRTALELVVAESKLISSVQRLIESRYGELYRVQNADEQHADLYKIFAVEKLLLFVIFSMIIGIASINIFFSLSMLVIEKKKDIKILSAMGASGSLIRRIFLLEGGLIALVGAGSGLFLGFAIAWSQQRFGFVSMGVASAVMPAYPVKILPLDFLYSACCIIMITLLASIYPASRASRLSILED